MAGRQQRMAPAAADVGVESITWIDNRALLLCFFLTPWERTANIGRM
jgi:hypothetical protein